MNKTRHRRLPENAVASNIMMNGFMKWQASAVRLGTVDPITTELVRLRCAQHHDCHT